MYLKFFRNINICYINLKIIHSFFIYNDQDKKDVFLSQLHFLDIAVVNGFSFKQKQLHIDGGKSLAYRAMQHVIILSSKNFSALAGLRVESRSADFNMLLHKITSTIDFKFYQI